MLPFLVQQKPVADCRLPQAIVTRVRKREYCCLHAVTRYAKVAAVNRQHLDRLMGHQLICIKLLKKEMSPPEIREIWRSGFCVRSVHCRTLRETIGKRQRMMRNAALKTREVN